MKFVKYSSIENSYRQREVDKVFNNVSSDETFIVQEKIHGSNFSFWCDGNTVRTARRTAFLGADERFNSHQELLQQYEALVVAVFHKLSYDNNEVKEIAIFGEVFGGHYPHKDVPALNVSKVQDKVYYSPKIEFMAFDIAVNGEMIAYSKVIETCQAIGIPFIPVLETGSLTHCLSYTNEFDTTIPALFNLPIIEDNTCEGTVIRSLNIAGNDRPIFKNKNSKFTERKKKPKTPTVITDEVQAIRDDLARYINVNRLLNVISKLGEVSVKDTGKLIGLLSKDVQEDFFLDEGGKVFLNVLEKDDQKKTLKWLNGECASLIRQSFNDGII